MAILTLNAGSSRIKFALYRRAPALQTLLRGQVDRIGHAEAALQTIRQDQAVLQPSRHAIGAGSFDAAAGALVAWLASQPEFSAIVGIGHRVVHGMQHSAPAPVNDTLLGALRGLTPDNLAHKGLQ